MSPPPSLRLIETRRALEGAAGQSIRSVALIGNYPPRRCGIATFTADVRAALVQARPDLLCDVYAMSDGTNHYNYPPEVSLEIRQGRTDDYLAAAARISQTRPDVTTWNHTYPGIGGKVRPHGAVSSERQ